MITYETIFTAFTPKSIEIESLDRITKSDLTLYGEIHGASENADIVYTLCKSLKVERLAVEFGGNVEEFIRRAVSGKIDFSIVSSEMFDSSILSIEMLKTIVTLLQEGSLKEIRFIDDTFDYSPRQLQTLTPDHREQVLSDNILDLDKDMPTLCILGNWHTRLRESKTHTSAVIRVRRVMPSAVLIYARYRAGSIYNDGRLMALPTRKDLSERYSVRQDSLIDFSLIIPEAHPIRLP